MAHKRGLGLVVELGAEIWREGGGVVKTLSEKRKDDITQFIADWG